MQEHVHAGLSGRMVHHYADHQHATMRIPAGAEVSVAAPAEAALPVSMGSPQQRVAQTWSGGAAQRQLRRDFSMPPPPALPSVAVPPPECSPFDVMSLPFDSIMGLVNARGHGGPSSMGRHQQQHVVKGMRARAHSLPGSGLSPAAGKGKPPLKPSLTRVIHPGANKASQRTPRALEIRSMPLRFQQGPGERTSPILAVPIQPAGSDGRLQSWLQTSGCREASQAGAGMHGLVRPSSAQELMRPASSQHDLNSPLQNSRGSVQQGGTSTSAVAAERSAEQSAEPEMLLDAMLADMPMHDVFRPGMVSMAAHGWPGSSGGVAAGTAQHPVHMTIAPTIPSLPTITSLDDSDAVFESVDQLSRMGGFDGIDAFTADIGLGPHGALSAALSPAPSMLQSARPLTADLAMGHRSAADDGLGWADVSIEELLGSWSGVGQAGPAAHPTVLRSLTSLDSAVNGRHLRPSTADGGAQHGSLGMRGLQPPSQQAGAVHTFQGLAGAMPRTPSTMQPAGAQVLQHAHTMPTHLYSHGAPDHHSVPALGHGQDGAATAAWGPGWGNQPLSSSSTDASGHVVSMGSGIRSITPAAPSTSAALNGHAMQDNARMGFAQERYSAPHSVSHLFGGSSILDNFQVPPTTIHTAQSVHGLQVAASNSPGRVVAVPPPHQTCNGAQAGMPATLPGFTFHHAHPSGHAHGLH